MKIDPILITKILFYTYENWTYSKKHDFNFPEFDADINKEHLKQLLAEKFIGFQNKRKTERPDLLLDKGIQLFGILDKEFIRNEIIESFQKLNDCTLEKFFDLSVLIGKKYEC